MAGDLGERRASVAIGVFDGVHVGHRAIIRAAVDAARNADRGEGIPVIPMTFWPHPAAALGRGAPPLICDLEERVRRLHRAGADHVEVVEFTAEFAALEPRAFFEMWIVDRLRAVAVSVGEGFRFGVRASGTTDTLRELCGERSITLTVVPTVQVDGEAVSSTRIRELISAGNVEAAGRLIGEPVSLAGEVVHGAGRGRDLGYPTANVDVASGLLIPGEGVYGGSARVDDRWLPAAISVGTNPQFQDDGVPALTVEAHLIDWDGDLYGRRLPVRCECWIRGQGTFESIAALVDQIGRDCEIVRSAASVRVQTR